MTHIVVDSNTAKVVISVFIVNKYVLSKFQLPNNWQD
jgi:hypothetical protein